MVGYTSESNLSAGEPLRGSVRSMSASSPSGWPPGRTPVTQGYQPQYEYPPEVPERRGPGRDRSGLVTAILGVVASLGAVLVFVSTFLSWITHEAVSTTGFSLMTVEQEGFFMIRWGWGGILFTGFFSLVMGLFMIIPAILLLQNNRNGASWSIATGFLGFFIALVNIIMIYATFDQPVSAGAGLWLFLAFSTGVLICGIVGLRYVE